MADDPTDIICGLVSVRRILQSDPSATRVVTTKGEVLRRLADLASDSLLPQHQFEAAWVLSIVTKGTEEDVKALMDAGVMESLLKVL